MQSDKIIHMNRKNGFLFVKLSAAIAVLFFHSFPLIKIPHTPVSYISILGFPMYEIAVDVFLVISGYLVYGSLLASPNLLVFFKKRIRRIYPALIVSVVITIVLIGCYTTDKSFLSFATSKDTLQYMAWNSIMLFAPHSDIQNAFPGSNFTNWVNPSLWTIPWELRLYFLLAALYTISSRTKSYVFYSLLITFFISSVIITSYCQFHHIELELHLKILLRLAPAFCGGAILHITGRTKTTKAIGYSAIPILAILHIFFPQSFFSTYLFLLPVLVIELAHSALLTAISSRFSNIDVSYGMYIYGFPIQQAIIFTFPRLPFFWLFVLSIFSCGIAGYASWVFIEKYPSSSGQNFPPANTSQAMAAKFYHRFLTWFQPKTSKGATT